MNLPKSGKTKEAILSALKERKEQDFKWKNGRIFASIYDAGEEARSVIYEAYNMFLSENLVDPTLFPSLRDMENEVVSMSARLLNGDDNTVGTLTSGGTESILLAVKTAKFYAKKKNPNIQPEIIVPYTIHFAFYKACEYFDVKPVVIPVDEKSYTPSLAAIEKAINANTIMIAASAPSYAYGAIDPIEAIAAVAQKHDVLFHVDGCIGAFVLSFYKDLGITLPKFDFQLPGVSSISMDLHKYGYAAKGCSTLLFRDEEVRKSQFFISTEWTGYNAINSTLLSTKPGGPVAGAWAAFHYFGYDGYLQMAKKTEEATRNFIDGILSIPGFYLLGDPQTPLVAFAHKDLDVFQIADEMKSRGWFLTSQLSSEVAPANLHLTVTVAHRGVEREFIEHLQEAVVAVKKGYRLRKLKHDATAAIVKKIVQNMDASTLGKVSEKLGIAGGDAPEKLALISRLLDELPNDVTQPMLVDFMSDFYKLKQ